MIRAGIFFLSRPRRFGKSLFLDTLKELFEGNQSLFDGLYAADRWDWSVQYPVIRISFGSGVLKTKEDLNKRLKDHLLQNKERLGLDAWIEDDLSSTFSALIREAARATGQPVVVLIDEYDKPILDNIEDAERATVG